jgi:DNA primase
MDLKTFITECHSHLLSDMPGCKEALVYLTARGLSLDSIKTHQLGYCPAANTPLLFGQDGSETRMYEHRLKGKITVPVMSEFGTVVGVAARAPSKSSKGWWNSRFDKDHHLYMFNLSRKSIFERNKAYAFEGYIDSIMLGQHNLPNSVAIMGTSLGYRRIGLLARYCDEICLCFDNDPNDAGLLGQLKTISDLWSLGFGRVFRVTLPQGVDPDEFVAKEGLEAFLSLETAVPEKEMKVSKQRYEDLRAKIKLAREVENAREK